MKVICLALLLAISASAQYVATTFNTGASTAATPTFSPGAGSYGSTQSVTISTATGGATICYNTTGSPTGTAGTCSGGSNTYSTPVSVASSETLYAIATKSGLTNSSVGSAAYTISGGTPNFINGTGADTTATTTTVATIAISHTAGNLLVAYVGIIGAGPSNCSFPNLAFSVANTAGDTWTPVGSNFNSTSGPAACVNIYRTVTAGNASDVTTFTHDTSANSNERWVIVLQFSNVSTLDAHPTGSAETGGGALTSNTFSTATANEAIVFCSSTPTASVTWVQGAIGGTTATLGATSSSTSVASCEYRIVSSTQSTITAAMSTTNGFTDQAGLAASFQ